VLRVAVRVMPPGSIADLDPSHIADKNLWLFQRGRPGLSDLPLVLNVETLEPRRKTRMQIIDVTAEYRTRLGIP